VPKDWQVAALDVQVRTGIEDIERKPRQATKVSRQVAVIREKAKAKLFEIKELEQAHDLYLEAFLLDPTREMYLRQAAEIMDLLIVRKRHIERMPLHLKELRLAFPPELRDKRQIAVRLMKVIGSGEHNPDSATYLLAGLIGLADGRYDGEREIFDKIKSLLAYILARNGGQGMAERRFVSALKKMSHDQAYKLEMARLWAYPEFGENRLFCLARKELGLPRNLAQAINLVEIWETEKKQSEQYFSNLVRGMSEAAAAALQVEAGKLTAEKAASKAAAEAAAIAKAKAATRMRKGVDVEDLICRADRLCQQIVRNEINVVDAAKEIKATMSAIVELRGAYGAGEVVLVNGQVDRLYSAWSRLDLLKRRAKSA
ncbi:MAG: hypothetical protein ABIE84_02480, partial [bacterium]